MFKTILKYLKKLNVQRLVEGLSFVKCLFRSVSSAAKKRNQVCVKSIAQHQMKVPGMKGKVSTASLHKLLPEDEQKLKDLEEAKTEEKNKAL